MGNPFDEDTTVAAEQPTTVVEQPTTLEGPTGETPETDVEEDEVEEDEVEDGDVEDSDAELEAQTAALEEPDDLDVDVDMDAEDTVEDTAPAAPGTTKTEKAEKAEKKPARPPVAEGYVSPVAFAKILTEHLAAKGAENKKGKIGPDNPITSQMVYSYIKNNAGSKNPFPLENDPAKTGGRVGVVKPEDGLKWWDDLRARVLERQANAKAKADKAAAKAEADKAKAETPQAPEAPVVEAE
jgi:hypothetical protein